MQAGLTFTVGRWSEVTKGGGRAQAYGLPNQCSSHRIEGSADPEQGATGLPGLDPYCVTLSEVLDSSEPRNGITESTLQDCCLFFMQVRA